MKEKNIDYKIVSEKVIKDLEEGYDENPELLGFILAPKDSIGNQREINKNNSQLNNSKSDLNFPKKLTILQDSIDAKIKHRKKREGD